MVSAHTHARNAGGMHVDELIAKVTEYLPPDRVSLIEEAYEYAEEKHAGGLRLSGEPYIQHPLHAAHTVAQLGMDAGSVVAALLHDTMEDCGVAPVAMTKLF